MGQSSLKVHRPSTVADVDDRLCQSYHKRWSMKVEKIGKSTTSDTLPVGISRESPCFLDSKGCKVESFSEARFILDSKGCIEEADADYAPPDSEADTATPRHSEAPYSEADSDTDVQFQRCLSPYSEADTAMPLDSESATPPDSDSDTDVPIQRGVSPYSEVDTAMPLDSDSDADTETPYETVSEGENSASPFHATKDREDDQGQPARPDREESYDTHIDLVRSHDFRRSFLQKLAAEKVWLPPAQRPPKQQTVVIFDWDDTLLCTSFLLRCEGIPLHPIIKKQLRAIGSSCERLLEHSLRLGHTFIITNAMDGWVEKSAAKYLPELLPVLKKVSIISARSRYEGLYPSEVGKWKISAFRDVQRQLNSQVITNLNSLGDSDYEMDATRVMGKDFEKAFVKTVKFRENPSPEELLTQLELIESRFEDIVVRAQNMKLGLDRNVGKVFGA